jgi:hypothetical protein
MVCLAACLPRASIYTTAIFLQLPVCLSATAAAQIADSSYKPARGGGVPNFIIINNHLYLLSDQIILKVDDCLVSIDIV